MIRIIVLSILDGFVREGIVPFNFDGITPPEQSLFKFSKIGKRIGFEFKYTDTPKITSSMKISLEDLKLDQIKIIFPGNIRFKLSEKIEAMGLEIFTKQLPK